MFNIIDINRYGLTPKNIKELEVNRRLVNPEYGFWRNDVIQAWCISGGFGPSFDETEFWFGIYDKPRKNGKTKIDFYFSIWSGMGGYSVKKFFDKTEIEHESDYLIQKEFIETMNRLIDAGVLSLPEKKKKGS